MKELIRSNRLTLVGIGIGALSGFTYYYYIGCTGGTCPITSQPMNSTIYGAIMGALLFSSFQKK